MNQPSLGDLDVKISIGDSTLAQMLPPEVRAEVGKSTSIDVSARVLRFSRHLLPGMSGGPVIDANGEVIAVVAGGLKNGTVPVSWGWPATHLPNLLTASHSGTGTVAPSTLFSTTKDLTSKEVKRCGALEFIKLRRATFGEIAKTADDPVGLFNIALASGRPRVEIDAYEFDIWTHRVSGATVAVPADTALVDTGEFCIARSESGLLEQRIMGAFAATQYEVQTVAVRFEQLMARPGQWFGLDPVLTIGPQLRADGFVVNRKGAMGVPFGANTAIHFFETLMARGGTFVGIMTYNNRMRQYQMCTANPAAYGCSEVLDELAQWTRFLLATRLSTYPVY